MFNLTDRELKFAIVISATHLTQHFLIRLLPPLIPVLAVALSYPLWKLGLLVSIFSVGSGLSQAPLGILSDRYDRLYILPTGIAVAGACYVLFAAAPIVGTVVPGVVVFGHTFEGSFVVMSVAMLFTGIGAAVTHPTGYPLITANTSEENKGKVLGAFGSSSKLGDALAPALVGVMILVLVWDQILTILGLVGLAFGILLYIVLRDERYQTVPAGHEGSDAEVSESSETVWEADNRTYLYPMTAIYVFFVTKQVAGKGVNTFLPAFIVSIYAYSFSIMDVSLTPDSVASFYFTALMLFGAVTQLFFGGWTDKYDPRFVILGCVSTATVGLLALAFVDLSPVFLLVTMLVIGGGLWGLNPARDALISEITPPEREGRTFGYLWTAVQLTGAAVPLVLGYIMETVGVRQGFFILAVGALLAGVSISMLFSDRVYISTTDQRERTPHSE